MCHILISSDVHFSLHHEREWKCILLLFYIVIIWCISVTHVSVLKQTFPSSGSSTLEISCCKWECEFKVQYHFAQASCVATPALHLEGFLKCVPAYFYCTRRAHCKSPSLRPIAQIFSYHTSTSGADVLVQLHSNTIWAGQPCPLATSTTVLL